MIKTVNLPGGAQAAIFPSAIVVYNYADGGESELSQIISAHPGQAVIFVATRFDKAVFSQAENTMRTFIFLDADGLKASVDPTYPAQWVTPGDFIPALPGNISIEATPAGFIVSSIAPDPTETHTFAN